MEPAAGRRAVFGARRAVDGWRTAERWVAIPGAGTIELARGRASVAIYPEGTVLVKHVSLPQAGREPDSPGNAASCITKTAFGIPTAICGTTRAAMRTWSIRSAPTGRCAGRPVAGWRIARANLARERDERMQAVPQRRTAFRARLCAEPIGSVCGKRCGSESQLAACWPRKA